MQNRLRMASRITGILLFSCLAFIFINFIVSCDNSSELPEDVNPWAFLGLPSGPDELPQMDLRVARGDTGVQGARVLKPFFTFLSSEFKNRGFQGTLELTLVGSENGFSSWVQGVGVPILARSMEFELREQTELEESELEPLVFSLANDGVVFFVNRNQDFIGDISFDEIPLILGTGKTWSDVRVEWPENPIFRFSPGVDEGVFRFLAQEFFSEDWSTFQRTTSIHFSNHSQLLTQGVRQNPMAIGILGNSEFIQHSADLVPLAIDGELLNTESVQNGAYPLVRVLKVYIDKQDLINNPGIAAFVLGAIQMKQNDILDLGFFPLTPAQEEQNARIWNSVFQNRYSRMGE